MPDPDSRHPPGFCTTPWSLEGPEIEVFCGGVNTKTPWHAAVWRQGNLLHFGFPQAPDQLDDNGRALLLNCVDYIARFRQDRPLGATPPPKRGGRRATRPEADLLANLTPARRPMPLQVLLSEKLAGSYPDDLALRWYRQWRDYLYPDADGRLAPDLEAEELGVPPASPEFLPAAIAALEDPESATVARTLLARYAPGGPGEAAPAAAWVAWHQAHAPYLYFSDIDGFRYLLDPLAEARGIPSVDLRGAARADR